VAGRLLDIGAILHEQTDRIGVAVVRSRVERILRARAKPHQVLGQLEIPPEGYAVPHWRRAPTSFRKCVIVQIDSVRHQHVSRPNARLGSASSDRCGAADMQPIAPTFIPMVNELRLLAQSCINGLPVEGPHEG
jgi:hypothetical protein